MARILGLLNTARFWQFFHGIAALIWLGLCVPGLTSWKTSIPFVIFVSLWANVVSHLIGWGASRAERSADPEDPGP